MRADEYVYGLVIAAHCQLGDLAAALQVHDDMAASGVARNQVCVTWRSLIPFDTLSPVHQIFNKTIATFSLAYLFGSCR